MIGAMIRPSAGSLPNISRASGTPVASDFTEPQNRQAMVSGTSKASARQASFRIEPDDDEDHHDADRHGREHDSVGSLPDAADHRIGEGVEDDGEDHGAVGEADRLDVPGGPVA